MKSILGYARTHTFTFLCFISISSYPQSTSTFKVKAGQEIGKVIPLKEMCRYEQFQEGHLYFPSGKSSGKMLLNYNFLFDELMFIDQKGDTLFVNNDHVFQYAEIGKEIYHHDAVKGYFEILEGNDRVKLLRKQSFTMLQRNLSGSNGYGDVSETSSVTSFRKATNSGTTMIRSQDVTYTKSVAYFYMDKDKNCMKVHKSVLIKLLPEYKSLIQSYVKKEKIDFDKESDLLRLSRYCLTLTDQ